MKKDKKKLDLELTPSWIIATYWRMPVKINFLSGG
jgi:hypothetical protein